MNAKLVALVLGLASGIGLISSASAQVASETPSNVEAPERASYMEQRLAAPSNALELHVGTAYTQGFGSLDRETNMNSVATPGIHVDAGAGYRIHPRWSVGVFGGYNELTAERASGVRGTTFGIASTYHIMPYVRSDPWVSLGSGYRLLWETNAEPGVPNTLYHGLELARLTAGLDVRVDEDVAISPLIGADLNMFLWRDVSTNVAIANPRLNTFVFAGVQGRFDIGGVHERESGARVTAHR